MTVNTLAVSNMDNMNKNKNVTRATTGERHAEPFTKINYYHDKSIR
jgi:hypothetical protein